MMQPTLGRLQISESRPARPAEHAVGDMITRVPRGISATICARAASRCGNLDRAAEARAVDDAGVINSSDDHGVASIRANSPCVRRKSLKTRRPRALTRELALELHVYRIAGIFRTDPEPTRNRGRPRAASRALDAYSPRNCSRRGLRRIARRSTCALLLAARRAGGEEPVAKRPVSWIVADRGPAPRPSIDVPLEGGPTFNRKRIIAQGPMASLHKSGHTATPCVRREGRRMPITTRYPLVR